jgi:iron complex outermembrane receptor protein
MKNIRYISYGFAVCLLVTGLSAQTAPDSSAANSSADQTSTTASGETVKLPSFQVNDTSDKGYLAANSVSATKIATRIADLPFAVSAFTPQFIADTGAQNIGDIVQYAAGVSNGSNGYVFAADFYVRGFLQYPETNGFFEGTNGNNYVDVANIERVEVVKGPASLLYGQIQPGGTVNYVTKSPQPKAFRSINAEFGSYNYGRVTLDVNQPLLGDKVEARLVYSYEGDYQFVKPGRDVQTVFAPSLKWNITPEL